MYIISNLLVQNTAYTAGAVYKISVTLLSNNGLQTNRWSGLAPSRVCHMSGV